MARTNKKLSKAALSKCATRHNWGLQWCWNYERMQNGGFAFAMILGVVIGTLTSLFIAAPVAYLTLGNKMPEEEAKA